MFIKIFLITVILFSIIMAGFGLKMLYNSRKKATNPACKNNGRKDGSHGCVCGMGHCDAD